MIKIRLNKIVLVISFFLMASIVNAEVFKKISTRDGVTVSFIKNSPLKRIKAAAVLFAGGGGNIGLDMGRKTVDSENFLVRSRKLFSASGILTITPDVPSDMTGLKNNRSNLDYRTDIAYLIEEIKRSTSSPIWLIGTSRGSITVGYHAPELNVNGIVLTASVTEGNNDTIFGADLSKIRIPTLIVHHENDVCIASPPSGTNAIFNALTNAPKKHVLLFNEGNYGYGRDCGATTPHGFLGIEREVVSAITTWMLKATDD